MREIKRIENYRIIEVDDEFADLESLAGDTFSPEANPDMDATKLMIEQVRFNQDVQDKGVYGYILERWNPSVGVGWETVDSCFGFVGQYNDDDNSPENHYIVDEFVDQVKKVLEL